MVQYKKDALKKMIFLFFYFLFFFLNIKMIKKSKEPIDFLSVDLDQIVVSYKFKHNDKGFKHFIGYLEGEIVKALCIILPQMSTYIKYFKNGGKNMSF